MPIANWVQTKKKEGRKREKVALKQLSLLAQFSKPLRMWFLLAESSLFLCAIVLNVLLRYRSSTIGARHQPPPNPLLWQVYGCLFGRPLRTPPFLWSCRTTRIRLLLINLQHRQRDFRSAKGSGIVPATFNVRWLSATGMTDNRGIIFTEERCPTPAIKPPILIQMTSPWLLWRGRAQVR